MSALSDRAADHSLSSSSGNQRDDRYAAIKAAIDDSSGAAKRWVTLLQDTTSLDPDQGLRLWQRIYAEALIGDDVDTFTSLVSEWFPFGEQNTSLLNRFRAGTEAIKSERYRDSLEMLTDLLRAASETGVAPLLSQIDRALLSILIGRVLLYDRTQGETAITDLDEAKLHLEEARSLAPEDCRPYAALAEYYRLAGRLDEARRMCDEAAARAPHGPDVHVVRGLLLEGEGSWDEAGDQYERAIRAVGSESEIGAVSRSLEKLFAPISGSVYLRLARMLQERHPERAHRAVEEALRVGRSRAARLQIENGDEHVERTGLKLLGEILESISRRFDAAAAYYQSGLRSVTGSDHKTAADLFARASSLDSSIVGVHWFWADALRVLSANSDAAAMGDPVEDAARVLDVWDEGFALGPPSSRFAWAYLTRGRVLGSLAELQLHDAKELRWQASANLEQSLILDRSQGDVWLELARCHRLLGNHAVALQAVRMATLLSAESLGALFEQALILAVAGGQDGTEAVRSLRKEVRRVQDRPELSSAIESIAAGADLVEALVLYGQRRPAEAILLLDQAVTRMPNDLSLRNLRANARRMAGDRNGAVQDFVRIWEDAHAGSLPGNPADQQIRAGAGIELGHYAQALDLFDALLNSGLVEPFGVRMGLCYSSLGLGRTAQADRHFTEALVHLRHPGDVQNAVDDLESLGARLDAAEHQQAHEVIARFSEVLKARAQGLPSINDPLAAEQEFRHVLAIDLPQPGSSSWLGAHAGLARLDANAGRLGEAASGYEAILQSDAERTPPRFPEAGVALLGLASTEAQAGFSASERADLPSTLGHFCRSLQLRTLVGAVSTPLDLLNDVAGLIYSDEQRETLETALQELADGAASKRDT